MTAPVVGLIKPDKPRRPKTYPTGPRIPRYSAGWKALLQYLKEEPTLRVLDIGPTSSSNINFLTGIGHSVYMADIVQEGLTGEWDLPAAEGEELRFDGERFFKHTLGFGDRRFEVVLLWATIDYLPDRMVPAVIARLHECMTPGGKLLAFFHTKNRGNETTFCRYDLIDGNEIEMQESGPFQVQRVYTNREIERLFNAYSECKFFLARDSVYEVIITR